jgi:hypothetical protein
LNRVQLTGISAGAQQSDSRGVIKQPGHAFRGNAKHRRNKGGVDARAKRRRHGQGFSRGHAGVADGACGGLGERGDLAPDRLPDVGRDRHLVDRGRPVSEQTRQVPSLLSVCPPDPVWRPPLREREQHVTRAIAMAGRVVLLNKGSVAYDGQLSELDEQAGLRS